MALHREDMGSGSESELLDRFTVHKTSGLASLALTVVAGGVISDRRLSFQAIAPGAFANGLLEWSDGPATADGDLLVVWELVISTSAVSSMFPGPAHRFADADADVDAVLGVLDFSVSIDKVGRCINGASGFLEQQDPSQVDPATQSVVYVSRLNVAGTDRKLRIWEIDEDEPDAWTLETDASGSPEPSAAGRPGISAGRLDPTEHDLHVHLFSFSDDPDVPAPLFLSGFHPRGRAAEARRRSLQA